MESMFDEPQVYQHNVYAKGCEFHSFKKVMKEMGSPYADMQMASFMSISKGECVFEKHTVLHIKLFIDETV